MSALWHVHVRTTKKKPTAEQQRQQHKAALLQACKEGLHSKLPTFRPSESICQGCGSVFYCPVCFKQQGLTPAKNGRALVCPTHQKAKVQA
jgi:hypothetical protein